MLVSAAPNIECRVAARHANHKESQVRKYYTVSCSKHDHDTAMRLICTSASVLRSLFASTRRNVSSNIKPPGSTAVCCKAMSDFPANSAMNDPKLYQTVCGADKHTKRAGCQGNKLMQACQQLCSSYCYS